MTRSRAGAGRRLIRNIVAGVGAQATTALAALWSIPVILSKLGASGYGLFSLAGAVVGYFSLGDLGLANASTQLLARARAGRDEDAFNRVFATTVAILGTVGLIFGAALFVSAPWVGHRLAGPRTAADLNDVVFALRVCALGAMPALLRPALEAVLAASERLSFSYGVSTCANLIRTLGVALVTSIRPSATAAVATLVAATILQFVLLSFAVPSAAPELKLIQLRPNRPQARELLLLSVPLWLTAAASNFGYELPKLLVSAFCGLEALAGYALAVDVASRLWLIPNVVGRAYFARLANLLATEHPGDHRRELENYAVITTGAVVTAAIPLSVMAAPLLRAWTGSASLGSAGSTLTWLTWGIVASVVSHAPFTTLQLRLHTRVLFFANLVFLVVHAGAATVLVRVMGPQGAAASWTVGQAAITLALHFAMFRLYGVALTNVMVRAALAIAAGLLGALILTSLRQVPAGPATGSLVSRLAPLVPHAAGLAAITGTTLAALVFSHRRRAVER